MSTSSRLTGVFNSSGEIFFDNNSRFILFSDCHRGDNSRADNFAPNEDIYKSALKHYYNEGYNYIEIGDGDELWENSRFSKLIQAHPDTYLLMQKFFNEGRLYMIWGNHDIYKRSRRFMEKNLYKYYNPDTRRLEPLFEGLEAKEGLILRYSGTPYRIFITHGHQADFINDRLWMFSCLLSRYIWRWIEIHGVKNPLSPARNARLLDIVQEQLIQWVRKNNQMLIAGHTHSYNFPKPGQIPYFNDGCCVKKNYITGIEIANGEITLVKWFMKRGEKGNSLIDKETIAGPERIKSYFSPGMLE